MTYWKRNALIISTVLLILGAVLALPPLSRAQSSDDAGVEALRKLGRGFTSVARRAMPAVVFIDVERTVEMRRQPFPFEDDFFERFFGQPFPDRRRQQEPREFKQRGQGSGFLISPDGYILTNHHVVGEADEITVKLHDNRRLEAELIGTDPKSDVALIKVDATGLPHLEMGDSDDLQVGEWVVAIGNPFGLTETVTTGVVSAKGRSAVGITDYEDFIQTDAAINPGNSGGPLLTLDGRVVGINTAIFSRSGGYMGIGFAIPINMGRKIQKQLRESGKVTRGYLGVVIQNLTPALARSLGADVSQGVLVAEVADDTPAARAELASGDIITHYDATPVKDVGDLRNAVSQTVPGTEIQLSVIRDGERMEIPVTIGELSEEKAASGGPTSDLESKLGLDVAPLSREKARELGYEPGRGVLIQKVVPGTPAAEAGLKPGTVILSVNRKSVSTPAEFQAALDKGYEGRVLLHVKEGQFSRYVLLETR